MTAAAELGRMGAMGLIRLSAPGESLSRWFHYGISLALLAAVILHLRQAGLKGIDAVVPAAPGFWLALLALYFVLPVTDWLIFRHLWQLPLRGFPVILRKRLSNELLVGYSGEVYFYLWARRHAALTAAPFGAIKDVNILSALAANLLSLILLAISYPLMIRLDMGRYADEILLSGGIVLALSIAILLLRNRIFTLTRSALLWITAAHMVRLVLTTFLFGLACHLALPSVALGTWLSLATLRLLVTRMPLVPGKDLLFAAVTILLIGKNNGLSDMVAVMAALTLIIHLLVACVLGVFGLFEREPAA